jgi:hypothetical protein
MPSTFQPVLSIIYSLQAAFSAYSLYLASISISNLQKYEEKSEKAAEWSNTAEKQLHKSRTTQASGTIAVGSSLMCQEKVTNMTCRWSRHSSLLAHRYFFLLQDMRDWLSHVLI